jgi:hypothetical protein
MIRTYIDSGVLIAAATAQDILSDRAFDILKDTNRELASSIFFRLEIFPKATYHKRTNEIKFYHNFFQIISY